MKISLSKDTKQTQSGIVHYWVARWYDGTGRRRSKSLGKVESMTKRQAKKLLLRMEKDFEDSPALGRMGRAPTVKDFVDTFLERRKHNLAPATIVKYKKAAEYLLRYFGEGRRIDHITVNDAEAFRAKLADGRLRGSRDRGLCATSVNIQMRQIRALFQYAVDTELIPENPFRKSVVTVKTAKGWHYVSREEFQRIMAACPPKIGLVVALSRLAGLRRGEALHLRWDDIDWQNGRLVIVEHDDWKPKDHERRIVPLCAELADILLKAYEQASEGQVKVCEGVIEDNLHRDISAAVKRAGLLPYAKPFHTLRKNCLTDWARTLPMHVVAAYAGHANITTTSQYYLQVSEADYDRISGKNFWSENTENGRKIENQTEKPPVSK